MGEGDPSPPPPKYELFTDYYLHPSEGSQLVICLVLLTVDNYEEWSRSIRNNLRSKSKLGFVDGSIVKPDSKHSDYRQWGIINSIVVSWIYNTLDASIRSINLLSNYVKLPAYTCSAAKEYAKLHENDLLHLFCLGLDPKKFGFVVSTLLMSDPLPIMNAAYAKVVVDECKQSVFEKECTYCKKFGHDKDHCNELHGFPGGGRGVRSFGKGKGEFARAVGSCRGSNEQVSDSDRGSVPTFFDAQWKEIMVAVKGAKSGSSSDSNKLGTYNSIEWLIETRASNHLSGNIVLFIDLYDVSSPVGLPNGKSTTATKEGRVFLSDGLTLDNDHSLKNLIGAGEQCDGVYIFRPARARNLQENKVVVSYASVLWHRRLGHSSMQVLICEFCAMAKTQFGRKVKVIRSDNGQEFLSLGSFTKKGILHQTSCVDTTQQNGRVERKHRHILNVARAPRFQAKLPKYF
ncbi:uncharacterized protein LOC110692014 [Chenopodium quinoa]|uniref:uncharacterized protein LOC110692014 n=1 Tax=Chenopodium quinoa TaxID=63459 RepID=UPI000B78F0B7|nr:uncharacterized protein LOC110692014 [Chenopodium quinoa]